MPQSYNNMRGEYTIHGVKAEIEFLLIHVVFRLRKIIFNYFDNHICILCSVLNIGDYTVLFTTRVYVGNAI